METLGVEKYYKTEERILDKKISKDGDNPANEKPNRFNKRPMPGLAKTSYDWVILDSVVLIFFRAWIDFKTHTIQDRQGKSLNRAL